MSMIKINPVKKTVFTLNELVLHEMCPLYVDSHALYDYVLDMVTLDIPIDKIFENVEDAQIRSKAVYGAIMYQYALGFFQSLEIDYGYIQDCLVDHVAKYQLGEYYSVADGAQIWASFARSINSIVKMVEEANYHEVVKNSKMYLPMGMKNRSSLEVNIELLGINSDGTVDMYLLQTYSSSRKELHLKSMAAIKIFDDLGIKVNKIVVVSSGLDDNLKFSVNSYHWTVTGLESLFLQYEKHSPSLTKCFRCKYNSECTIENRVLKDKR